MKRAITLVLVALLTLPAFNQELSKSEQKKLNKQLKKEQQAEELAESAKVVTAMVNLATFVLEANSLRNKQGESLMVTTALNFVAVDSTT